MSNGYMIRLELLKLAKESLFERAHTLRQAKIDEFHATRENNISAGFPDLESMPTIDDVMKAADKLNEFIKKQ